MQVWALTAGLSALSGKNCVRLIFQTVSSDSLRESNEDKIRRARTCVLFFNKEFITESIV